MAPKRGGTQQQLNVDQFKLLKKTMEHLGNQINVSDSFWQVPMLAEERNTFSRNTCQHLSWWTSTRILSNHILLS